MLALTVVFLVLGLGVMGFAVYFGVRLTRQKETEPKDFRRKLLYVATISLGAGILFIITFVFLALHNQNDLGLTPLAPFQWVFVILGTLLAFAGLSTFIPFFIIRYYKKSISSDIAKVIRLVFYISAACMISGTIMLLDGFVPQIQFPLVNGFDFSKDGFWTRIGDRAVGNFSVAFYGIFILLGVAAVYFFSDHKMYQQYGEHGLLDSTLIAGVVPGIIGARLWWCIADPNGSLMEFFNFRSGGLAVQGGVILGVLCGALWFIWRKPKYSIFVTADIVVPTILLAQFIGRWGNFFNQEVYGATVGAEFWMWKILPQFIVHQMEVGGVGSGIYAVPLFLIEGLINLLGFILIVIVAKPLLKRWWKPGDGAAAYFVWYGVVRVALEGFRNQDFIMDANSFIMSGIFIGVGVVAIVANHLIRYFLGKHKAQVLGTYKHKVLICDFDGTLANSDIMLHNTFKDLYRLHRPGEEITLEEAQTFSGPLMVETLKKQFPDVDQEKVMLEYKRISEVRSSDVVLYPNVKKTLSALHRKGITLAVFTNKTHDSVVKQLKRLRIDRFFSIVIGVENVQNPKPAPDGLDLIVEKLNVNKDCVVFVGDSKYDLEAGKNAGILSVIVAWSPRLSSSWTPDAIINDFADIDGVLHD